MGGRLMGFNSKAFFRAVAAGRDKQPSAAKVLGGVSAHVAGEDFESVVTASVLDREGRVLALSHLPKSGARFIGKERYIAQPIDFDFTGSVAATGQAIHFDAKSLAEGCKLYG